MPDPKPSDEPKVVDQNVAGQPAPAPVPAPEAGKPSPEAPKPGVTPNPEGEPKPEEGKQVPITALHEERDKRQSLQAELDALRSIAGNNILFDMNGNPVQAATPTPQASPHQQGPSDEFKKDLDKAWEDDPRQAVEMTVGAALQWRDDIEVQVDNQVMDASGKYDDFNTYQTDVRKYIRALPMNQRGNPGVVDMAYFVVKGQKSGNVYSKAQADMLEKIRKGEQVGGLTPGMSGAPAADKGTQLTEDQLKAANMMGLSPEDYKSAIK